MNVHVKAAKLYRYTMEITSNPKKFDPGFHDLADSVVHTAHQICLLIYEANDIRVGRDMSSWDKVQDARRAASERKRLQDEALRKCHLLAYDINICEDVYKRPEVKTQYWISLVMEVKAMIRKWRDSNEEEYSYVWD